MTKIISIISNGVRIDVPVREFVEKCVDDQELKKSLEKPDSEKKKKG